MLCRFDEYRPVSGVWPGDNLNLCSPFEPFRCVYRFASHPSLSSLDGKVPWPEKFRAVPTKVPTIRFLR